MPLIAPFRGLRYNPKRIKALSAVVTPPYDIISPEQQSQFYRRHSCNFIRVVYGKNLPQDTRARNVYSRARDYLEAWTRSGILKRDDQPSVYPYEQEYRLKGKIHRRLGVIALVPLDAAVYPHEEIHGGPKVDRLRLMKTTVASLDPIFGLVPDVRGRYERFVRRACRSRKPAIAFEFQGVRHRLWRITDPAWIKKLSTMLRSKELVIADGHHRFEAARAYRDERKRTDPSYRKNAPYNFVMFYLSAAGADESGLLPTHRLVGVRPAALLKKMLLRAQQRKWAEPVGSRELLVGKLQSLRSRGKLGVGLYTGNGAGYLLTPESQTRFHLDVEWLHQVVLQKWLEPRSVEVTYTQDLAGAYERVRRGQAQALFVVQRPRLKDVLTRAQGGRRMPRKTTYFYPKLVSGLVGFPFGG